jgi:hypothetical protein
VNEMTERFADLTAQTTQTFLDGVYLAQRQQAQIVKSWFETVEANQPAHRDLVGRFVQHGYEMQNLWLRYSQDSFRRISDRFVETAGAGLKEAGEQLDKAGKQAANGAAKRAEAAAAK